MNTKASKLAEIHEIYAYAMEARDHIMTALNEINQLERQTVTDDKRPFHLHPHRHQPPLLPFNDMDAIMNRLTVLHAELNHWSPIARQRRLQLRTLLETYQATYHENPFPELLQQMQHE